MHVPRAVHLRRMHICKRERVLLGQRRVRQQPGSVPNAIKRLLKIEQPADVCTLASITTLSCDCRAACHRRLPLVCSLGSNQAAARHKHQPARAPLCQPAAREQTEPARATRHHVHPTKAGGTNRNAHNHLARAQPALQRAERAIVLRFHVEACQWQARDDPGVSTCRQQCQRAVHPHRLMRRVRIERNRTERRGGGRRSVARWRPDPSFANLLESAALAQQRE
eukprot:7388920-Prymnesium_polylepis.2